MSCLLQASLPYHCHCNSHLFCNCRATWKGDGTYKVEEESEPCARAVAEGTSADAHSQECYDGCNYSVHEDDGIGDQKPPALCPNIEGR